MNLDECSCIWTMHDGGGSVYIADRECPARPHERTYTNEEEDSMDEQYKTTAKTVYLAGPMQGYEDFNFPLFMAAAELLRESGFEVVNPAELDEDEGFFEGTDKETFSVTSGARAKYMVRDLPHVVECEAIALLPGWQESTGSNIELLTALVCGREVWEFFEDAEGGGLVLAYSSATPDLFRIVEHVQKTYDE